MPGLVASRGTGGEGAPASGERLTGRASRQKGNRREVEFAHLTGGQRVPLSGAAGGSFSEDVLLPNGWRAQVKSRADGWRGLYAALATADVLAVRSDRKPWLVIVPLPLFLALLAARGSSLDPR